jgi:hypothetical protein
MKIIRLIVIFLIVNVAFVKAQTEEDIANERLRQIVENEHPVYLPVMGFSVGVLNFYGEVANKKISPLAGMPAYKINAAMFIDPNHYLRANVSFLVGTMVGEKRSMTDTSQNLNFKTDVMAWGVNLHYDFKNFWPSTPVRPFVSLGAEILQFSSKADMRNDATGQRYNYWSDGTIRNIPEALKYVAPGTIMQRDNKYETDLRELDPYGLGSYSQNVLGIPIDLGLDFKITDRINLRLGYSLHYTFTDNLDNISHKSNNPKYKGNNANDMFSYTYFSLHLDLFSEDRYIIIDNLVADAGDLDFDFLMYGDEDYDGVKDIMDQCPNTPEGYKVDSVGCPIDIDADGIPDYLDKDNSTPLGDIVTDTGEKVDFDELAKRTNIEGINRKEVEAFLQLLRAQSRFGGRPSKPIPSKFKPVDTDADGYISFDELLKAMNNFFDMSSEYTTKDIYELQDYFFEQ